ncbi:hypothetical protein B0H14DRAFT_2558931 [Mycena olivaceomarginata]|nr:hypothetical protein B0H14DRAFT_2558931 [Mycena olivaceomarginata]
MAPLSAVVSLACCSRIYVSCVTQTFTLPATLCGPIVLDAASNCYNCLAANGFAVISLQCTAAGSATLPQAGATIAADAKSAGRASGSGGNTSGGADGSGGDVHVQLRRATAV